VAGAESSNVKILNIGSVHIDHVYSVAHFVRPGECRTAAICVTRPGAADSIPFREDLGRLPLK
jgi:hypothetical protein